MPDETLVKIGTLIAGSDYAVQGFRNKKQPGFYKNRELMLSAIRKAYAVGAFNHREQAMKILQVYLVEKEYEMELKKSLTK